MSELTIVQLYPDELGVAGDRGNVMALTARLTHAGHSVTVIAHEVGSTLPTDVDLVIVGNGPLSAMRNIHADLLANGDRIRALRASGVAVFAYGSGAELLGHSITLADGTSLEGLAVLPFRATRVATRAVGYVIVDSPFGQIVGFEDNASRWTLDAGAMAKVPSRASSIPAPSALWLAVLSQSARRSVARPCPSTHSLPTPSSRRSVSVADSP